MAGRETKGTNIDLETIARIAATAQRPLAGDNAWFGPSTPPAPVAPAEVIGRAFDYAPGYNLNTQPRAAEPITFEQLRGLADGYDLLRLVIETRKDQLAKLKWGIKPKDQRNKPEDDSRVKELTEFLALPDKEHDWGSWLRMMAEDMLVLDAATIFPRRTNGGKIYSLDLIDGATIKRVLDDKGRVPAPPYPAYQQILKGLPAVNYRADEILYMPRNVRTNRVYGYSPVEQVVMTVNIALRRQLHQLQYYTEGNVPEALIGVPETWSTEQISQFQNYWDALLEGSTAQRRHARFVPATISKSFVQTKDAALKDEYDEWLARVVCYAFSVSNQAFVRQMNRSTADNAQEQALQEGLAPLQAWVKSVMDRIVQNVFGYTDLEFAWPEEEDQDPLTQAQINQIYLQNGVLSRNEVRALIGAAAITGGEIYTINAGGGVVPLDQVTKPPEPPAAPISHNGGPPMDPEQPEQAAEKLSKAAKRTSLDRNRATMRMGRRTLTKLWQSFLGDQGKKMAKTIGKAMGDALAKAEAPEDLPAKTAEEIAAETAAKQTKIAEETADAAIDAVAWKKAVSQTMDVLEEVLIDGIEQGFKAVGVTAADATSLANPRAASWAEDHAAKLVSGLSNTSRNALRDLIVTAQKEGWSVARLQQAIIENHAFSAKRAQLIAKHELATSDIMGNLIGWRTAQAEYGMKLRKRWIVSPDELHCAACLENARAGAIPLEEDFPSGQEAAPAHPRCGCDMVAEVDTTAEKWEGSRTSGPFDLGKAFNPGQPRDGRGRWTSGSYDADHQLARGNDAMSKVLAQKTSVHDAMDVRGLGSVHFIWGEAGDRTKEHAGGYGVAHIVAKHGEDAAKDVPQHLVSGTVTDHHPTRTIVEHDGHRVVLTQGGKGGSGRWILTAYGKAGSR